MKKGLRLIAKQAGKRTYLGDKPCKRGHTTERLTVNGMCLECNDIKNKATHVVRTKEKDEVEFDEMVERIEKIRGW